jgi:PAN domain
MNTSSIVISALALVLAMVITSGMAMELDTDRPGQDFQYFDLSIADPAACESVCRQNPNCRSWTYVKPNTIQGPNPRCWLKAGIPDPVSNACCVSGVVAANGPGRGGGLNSKQCGCWLDGYDSYPQTEGPGGRKDECDLGGMRNEWNSGWNARNAGSPRACP